MIAGVVIVMAAVAGYLLAGWAGLSVAVTAGAAAAMVVLRYLLPTPTPDAARKAREKPQARLLSGYSHRRFVVHSSIASRGFYAGGSRSLLSIEDYRALEETAHLLRSPANVRRLLESLDHAVPVRWRSTT